MHLLDVTEKNWHAIMDVNALGTLIGIQEGAWMMPLGEGKIVNVLHRGPAGIPVVRAVLRRQVRRERVDPGGRASRTARHNITCNAFAPGVVDTPLWTKLDEDLMHISDADRPARRWPISPPDILRGRVATGEDILGTALYMASADSDT